MGKDMRNRVLLWIQPKVKPSNHYAGTTLVFGRDMGASLSSALYQSHPIAWKYDGVSYHNARVVET